MSRLEEVREMQDILFDVAEEGYTESHSRVGDIGAAIAVIAAELGQISETLAMMLDKGEK